MVATEYGPAERIDTTHLATRSLTPPQRVSVIVHHVINASTSTKQQPVFIRNTTPAAALNHYPFSSVGPNVPRTVFLQLSGPIFISSAGPRLFPLSVLFDMLPKSFVSLARRGLHSKTRTFYSPTPDFLHEHLARDSLPEGSVSLFMLSTSLSNLPGHLSVLQAAFPTSIGSFSVSPPGSEPTVSLATFWGTGIKIFRSDLTGRAPAEVGRFQRPERQRNSRSEDRRGSTSRDVDAAFGQGWEKLWNGEVEGDRIPELEGVEADTFLLLSDSRPVPVLKTLDSMFPKAIKVGSDFLVGSQLMFSLRLAF